MPVAIPLANGRGVALVDAADYDLVSRYSWCLMVGRRNRYAQRTVRDPAEKRKRSVTMMHRLIMDAPRGVEVDHMNHDGLDNTRGNLRLASASQNHGNTRKQRGSWSSRFKGVSYHKHHRKWRATIYCGGRRTHIGYYNNEEDAARAYDAKARELFGEFACVNFPGD